MEIKVLGEGCSKCTKLYDNTLAALKELGIDADITKVESLVDIISLGVMTTPTLMVNGKPKTMGQVLSTKQIVKIFKEEL
ncbi:thioredoxin family protein [Clostridium sp.]|uniref:thioredoxin family protein n=1 Tax=Clostridium sp. TaxID=1506 RepID=UPI0032168736